MARQKRKDLSERQKKVLEVVDRFQKENGYPPAIRDIRDRTGITSTSVITYYLDQLEEMGFIERDHSVSRGIRLVQHTINEWLRIPILGRITAGQPTPTPDSGFSYYDAESMVEVATSMLPKGDKNKTLFALEVEGDSMIDAMIYDGDIVVMEPAVEARNGEMVAVWLNDRDETTLKYFYVEKGRVRLQPANPTMKPIYIDDPSTVQIRGKVVMVIRQVKGLVV